MDRYYKSQEPKPVKEKRKYQRPEKDTEKQVFLWAKANRFHLHIIDASSYDPLLKRTSVSKAQAGFPDLCGNTESGLSVWIELKAKDKRNTTSVNQRMFLEKKIAQNCFAVVVDSSERLQEYWDNYCNIEDDQARKIYLIDSLPKFREAKDNDSLF